MMRLVAVAIGCLGLFALGGLIALVRARWSDRTISRRVLWELTVVYVGVMLLISVEVGRSVWDCFFGDHFPLEWSTPLIVIGLVIVGRGAFAVYNLLYKAAEKTVTELRSHLTAHG